MIIHSKFQDYYDSALSLGVDDTIHYIRKEKEFFSDVLDLSDGSLYEKIRRFTCNHMRYEYDNLTEGRKRAIGGLSPSIRHVVIVIGRKVYAGALFTCDDYTSRPITYFCNTVVDLKNACEKSEMYFNHDFLDKRSYGYSIHGKSKTNAETFTHRIETMEKHLNQNFSEVEELMIELDTPILVFSQGDNDRRFRVIKDAFLKPYGIVSKLDPFQTFQEISMFMGNTLCNREPDMIEISDVHKRDGKGFDEASFKNRGGKKPRRKKK